MVITYRSWTFCKLVELLCAKIEQIIEYQTIHLNTKITDDNPNISVFISALIKHNNTCIIYNIIIHELEYMN